MTQNANTKVSGIRPGYHTVSPYLMFKDASAAIAFYSRAFGAKETRRLSSVDNKIMHAEIRIGDSIVMLADECPAHDALSPETLGGSPGFIVLCVEDVDAQVHAAVEAGAKILRPLQDQFSGDRSATLADPFGYRWTLTTHVEDISDQEIDRRFAAMMGNSGPTEEQPLAASVG